MKPIILATQSTGGTHRQFVLTDITVSEITAILGFGPNHDDDPDKVENSWSFTLDGNACAIWDYKGSHHYKQFSCFGRVDLFRALFGSRVFEADSGRVFRGKHSY